jgi:hypothetical protein
LSGANFRASEDALHSAVISSVGPERTAMLEDLCEMAKSGVLTTPDCETFQLNDYEAALKNAVSSFTKKSLFLMS